VTNTTSTGGQVTISLPAESTSGNFTLTGVLVSLAGVTAPLNVNVSASPGNGVLIVAGQNVATVITNILPGIKDPKVTTATVTGSVLSSGIVITPGFSVDITENYQDMFRDAAQFDSGFAANDTELMLTFNNIPTGVTIGGCSAVDIDPLGVAASVTATSATLTSTANTEILDFTSAVDLVNVDTVRFSCTTFTVGSSATVPFAAGSLPITMTATLAPVGTALSSTSTVLTTATTGQIPRYTANQQPATPLVVINLIPAQTTLLIPYAVTTAGGYDTGIALANTTADPFGGKTLGSAIATSGTVTLSFYPTTGNSCSLTTAAGSTTPATSFTTSPISGLGVGLDSTGNLDSGRTWVVLLSQLLGAAPSSAGCPAANSFTGYIFVVANSTEVHGSAFVSNFSTFTSASNVLVLATPATNLRSQLQVESLGN
jgi:hypothetical protein